MPNLVFRSQKDLQNGRFTEYLNQGNIQGFFVNVEGTATSQLDIDDLGNIKVNRNGRNIINKPFAFFHRLMKEWGGTLEETTPATGATRVVTFVPFFFPEIANNALEVLSDQELRVDVEQGTLSAFGSNAVTTRIIPVTAPQLVEVYEPEILDDVLSFGGSGTQTDEIGLSNITRILLEDSNGTATSIQLSRDGRQVVDSLTSDEINDYSNMVNRVESNPDSLIEINPLEGLGIDAIESQFHRLRVEASGATDVTYTWIRAVNYNPARLQA